MDKQVGITALVLLVIGVLVWIVTANWDLLGIGDEDTNGNGDVDTSNDNGNGTTGGGDPNGDTGETGSNGTARPTACDECTSPEFTDCVAACATVGQTWGTCSKIRRERGGACETVCTCGSKAAGGGSGFLHRRTRQRKVA